MRPRYSTKAFVHETHLAMLAVLLGLVFALMLVPADVEVPGALRPSAMAFAVGLCCVPLLTLLGDTAAMLRAEYVLLVSPIYWLLAEPLQAAYSMTGVRAADVDRGFIAMAIFMGAALVAFAQRPWRAPAFITAESRDEPPANFYFAVGLIAFFLAFCRYAIPSRFDFAAMYDALQGGRWAGAWQRGALGGADAFLDHLGYFGYIVPPLTVLLGRRLSWRDPRTLMLAAASVLLSLFLIQSGSRRLIGVFYGTALVVWLLALPKLRIVHMVGIAVLAVGLLVGLERVLTYRDRGVLATASEQEAQPVEGATALKLRVDDNFLRLAQIARIFPAAHPYLTWRFAVWVAARPIPRLFWPGKPVDPGVDFAALVGVKGATLSASVIGELLMAGGLFAVALGGWFYGKVATALSRFLNESKTSSTMILYAIGLLALFGGMRSLLELLLTSYVVLSWIVLVRGYRVVGSVLAPPASTPAWRARSGAR